ncbi:hypothetical protein C8J55DRAFT_442642 [Lentinula edodes]|uniref:Uncharacterized protein n=1 Tax=Lentinula lateritia TaxID=40482 RepID=A0A9W9DDV6_9AGAR|nr:hypothetical protein C8J55DRAFT_442642 [Lentinula edodes]
MQLSSNSRIAFFRDWLVEIAEAYIQSLPTSTDKLTAEQRRILDNSDSSCPFRELAHSRCQVSGPDGPFVHHSPEGIFSALLFRGILFNTEALRETGHSGFFESFEAWSQFKSHHIPRGEHYICNPSAYGTTKGRVVANDEQFWNASKALWEKLLEPEISFTSIWRYIANAKNDQRKKLFPSFGNLSSYLLVADFAYAQWVPWPDIDEVAQAVFTLNKGALHGLQKMQLIPASSYTQKDVEESFKVLYQFLDKDPMFALVKTAVVFDPFMVEHALCKVSKDRVYERVYCNVHP